MTYRHLSVTGAFLRLLGTIVLRRVARATRIEGLDFKDRREEILGSPGTAKGIVCTAHHPLLFQNSDVGNSAAREIGRADSTEVLKGSESGVWRLSGESTMGQSGQLNTGT